MHKPDVLFILTVDTEEEWLWEDEFPSENCSVKNVERLPDFQAFCEQQHIRPTYFVDYAVAQDATGMSVLKRFVENNKAEVGAHLHPWCNPPFFGKTTEAESHVINLPTAQVEQKLDTLTDIIRKNIGVTPRSFRSGRWGINGETMALLAARGYQVDSSVYPFYRNEFFTCEGAPTFPYWPSLTDPLQPSAQREIMEIPVSAGFNIKNQSHGEAIHNFFAAPQISWTKSIGMLWHSGLLKKIYLSPELTDSTNMNLLIDSQLKNNHPVIHMYLHSSSFVDNATGLMSAQNAFELITARIKASISHLTAKANVRFCTISEASVLLNQLFPNQDILFVEGSI